MKTYEFPYTGNGGKGDGWVGAVTVKLTDEQADLLEASMEDEEVEDFEDDYTLIDIEKIVMAAIIDNTVKDSDPDYLREFGEEEDSLEECARKLLYSNGVTIHYPGSNWW